MTLLVPAIASGSSLEGSLRALLRQAAAGAVHVDLDGRFIEVNAQWIQMLGYSAAELAGMRVADVTHPDDLAETIAAVAQLKAGLSGFVVEKRYIAKDGQVVWSMTNVTATRDAEGRATGMFAMCVDITARKETERRLAFLADLSQRLASLAEERAILEATVEAVGRYAGAHRCYFIECFEREDRIVVSPNWSRDGARSLEGTYSLFEFGGPEWWAHYAAGDFTIADVAAHPLTQARAAHYLGYDVRAYAVQPFKKDGPRTVVLAVTDNAVRHWTPADRALLENVVARVWPLVEHARAEKALRDAREAADRQRRFFETILASSLDFIAVIDREHRFVYVNERLAQHWGRKPADFIGRTLAQTGHSAPQVEQHTRELQQVFATAAPLRAEVAGGERRFEYIMAPIVGEDGDVEAVASVTRDVTESRRRSEQKDHFIAMLAHELRNPLAPLRTGLEVARLSPDPGRALESLRPMLERQVRLMVSLVDDLLDMSRIGLGKIELRRARVLLANVVADAVETCRPAMDAAGLALRVDLPAEPLYIDADLTRFAQVLGNLLHNATKFTPRGGWVAIEARRDGPEVEVVVRDNGVGIPPDKLERIFELFTQAGRGMEIDTGGLGIGLALVKGLVELHGGTVRADSDGPGRGSAFTLRLPVLLH